MATARIHPLTGQPKTNGVKRNGVAKTLHQVAAAARVARAGYDAASESDEFSNYWANADSYDANAANSQAVRAKLVQRSRYEVQSNGYVDGIHATLANYTVGLGPSLRMRSRNEGFNQAVEALWNRWAKLVGLRRKLWCLSHARSQDGEAFALMAQNGGLPEDGVQLDLLLFETEQCTTPFLPADVAGYIDGIKFDKFGNPQWYDVLDEHPGSGRAWLNRWTPKQVPAAFVLHWFKLRRPGQQRGVPELTSTLNVGASSRRWREATVAAAETAAEFAAVMKTQFQPDAMEEVEPMTTTSIQKRMMVALPAGWDATQMRAEHPGASYEGFLRTQLTELGRPKSIPFNLAAMDSSTYSFASGKLDHLTFFGAVDIDRADCSELVLDRLFERWFAEAALLYGWNPAPPDHGWDWPKHPVADVGGEAAANDTKLRNGTTTLSRIYADAGLDFEDVLTEMATDYGLTVDEMRGVLLRNIFGPAVAVTPDDQQEGTDNGDVEQQQQTT